MDISERVEIAGMPGWSIIAKSTEAAQTTSAHKPMQTTALPLASCIGFSGSVENGLQLHPDGQTLVYPLGSTIVVRDLKGLKQQDFLQGHTDKVGVPDTLRHVRVWKEAMRPQSPSATCRCHAWPSASQGATWPQVRHGCLLAMPLSSPPASCSMTPR